MEQRSVFPSYRLLTTGVRQGGVLTPAFFSVYIDDLLIRLNASNLT
jgi:hypothetical protein